MHYIYTQKNIPLFLLVKNESRNENQEMKVKKVPCRSIRYKEFPDLLFGTPQEGAPAYFDATHFIQSRGDEKRHSLADFRVAFHLWIEELCRQYEIDREDLFIRDEASGHLLIDECLALLFVRNVCRWIYGFRHLAGSIGRA